MRLFASMLYCLMGLFGCHQGTGTTSITRATVDGRDLIFSKTESHAGSADFHCLASASGHCHYLVYAEQCAAADQPCQRQPLERFSLAVGQTRQLTGLPQGFGQCASAARVPARC